MNKRTRAFSLLVPVFFLSACGGGGSDDDEEPPIITPTRARGDLLESPPTKLASYSTADLIAAVEGTDEGQEFLLRLALDPKCTVDVHQLGYRTVDPAGDFTPASGALMIPNGSDDTCRGARPIILYAHGTSTDRNFNIADLPNNGEGALMAAVFASQGYIVVAPNYVGYDSSTLDYHPYLNGDQQSKDMIDALTAARSALPTSTAPDTTDGGKLFVTGYSQGGYVAMATHRAMEDAGITVTASGPMSGPYALAAFGDAVVAGQVSADAVVNMTLILSSYQRAYGSIYEQPTEVFEAQYATGIESLLPSTTPIDELRDQGMLPEEALLSSTPPADEFASITPATTPAELASVFALGFGPDNLITNNFRLAYLEDAALNPDGGFPTVTDDLPPDDPAHPLRQALKTNDLRNWTPTAPVLLCAGNLDPTVFYLNTQLMQDYWGAVASSAPLTVLDLDSPPIVGGDDFAGQKAGFAIAKAAVSAEAELEGEDGDSAVLEAYHAGLVPPFCLSAVKDFFDGL